MKSIGVLTSGGDAPGMNAAIRAVVRSGIYYGCKVYGINRGYNGLLEEDFEELNLSSVGDIIHRGGTILKSSRSEEFKTNQGRIKAAKILQKHNIDCLIVIGGDGSFIGASKLSELGISTIGIPATIDNDLAYTDYTIGFDTAMNTVVDAISKIRDTSSSHERVNIVEVMGRHCGDIALFAGLAGGAETIVVPEEPINIDDIAFRLKTTQKRGKRHSIIVLAEGADSAGNLKQKIEDASGLELRVTILGHVQRGGSPTVFDRILASKMGVRAVELLLDGISNRVVGIKDNDIVDLGILDALSKEKRFDRDVYEMAKILSI